MNAYNAQWFDGRRAEAQPVQLLLEADSLVLLLADGSRQRHPCRRVSWPERTRHGLRQLLLPDGSVVQLGEAAAWDAWAAQAGLGQPLAARWALSWPLVMGALLLLLAVGFGAWRWGIPWGAQQLANWVPASLERRLGEQLLHDIERRGWIRDSALNAVEQAQIQTAVAAMVSAAYPRGAAPDYRLHVRKAPRWLGPNAFALPGGDIVVTDALVELLREDQGQPASPALLGVVAHELGHVRERHGLRLVFEAGALSVLAGWWIGDYSSLLAAAPTLMLQAGYSRDHERAADAEARRVMQAAGIDPRAMVRFFQRLKEEMPKRDGDDPFFGLSSHPPDSERVRFFEEGR